MNDPYLLISTFPLFLNTLMKVLKNISSEVLFIYDSIIACQALFYVRMSSNLSCNVFKSKKLHAIII